MAFSDEIVFHLVDSDYSDRLKKMLYRTKRKISLFEARSRPHRFNEMLANSLERTEKPKFLVKSNSLCTGQFRETEKVDVFKETA